jgi:RHS repeat-associated protein
VPSSGRDASALTPPSPVYLDGDLCAEADVNWNQTAAYFYQPGVDRPVTRTDSAGTVWYLQDLSGSVSALAKNDGTLYGRYYYSPWGEIVSADGGMPSQPLKWTARELDNTGLYYLRSRYYLSSTGRFLSEDGIGLAGGATCTSSPGTARSVAAIRLASRTTVTETTTGAATGRTPGTSYWARWRVSAASSTGAPCPG